MDMILNGQVDAISNRCNPEWIQSQMSQMDMILNEHNHEWKQSQMDTDIYMVTYVL